MIYTVTLNPSIDYIVYLDDLEIGGLNRMKGDRKLPGGKGINVSRVLRQLDMESTALGFLGGFTGSYIEEWLQAEGIRTDFTPVPEATRINVKLKAGAETEINGQGPTITPEQAHQLLQQLEKLEPEDLVVLSGSKAPGLPENYYQQLIEVITKRGARFILDTTGAELLEALPARPLLVKPNHVELAELFETTLRSTEDIAACARKLLDQGAQNVIVSRGGEGALLVTPEGIYAASAPKGTVVNTVGSGDSMIAGFLAAYLQTGDALAAFRQSIQAGSATAFKEDLAERADIAALAEQITIQTLHKVNK